MAKSPKDKIKDALGIKEPNEDKEKDKEEEDEEEEEDETEDFSSDEESSEETPAASDSPQSPHRGPGRPPKNNVPQPKPKTENAVGEQPQKTNTPTPLPPPMVKPASPYLWFIQNNQCVTPADLATFQRGDGLLVVFTDPAIADATFDGRVATPAFPGGRPALNCSLYLTKDILDKLLTARKATQK